MTGPAIVDRASATPRPGAIQSRPVVTVVMANHNGARTIEAALRSALRQSLRDIEVIVADNGSTDDSADRVAAIAADDNRVRLLRAPDNGGPGAARDLCLDVARGEWIAILDSDDLMHPDRLAWLLAAAERDGADIVADDLLIFHDDLAIPPRTCLPDDDEPRWIDATEYVRANTLFSGRRSLGYLKPLIRSALIEEFAVRYDTTLRIAEDYDFILRLLLLGARFRVCPRPLYFYRRHAGSISHRLSRATLEPMLAAHDRSTRFAAGWDGANADRGARFDAAMAARRASLCLALQFDDLVSALRRHDWSGAAALALSHPRAAARLRGPLLDRMRRLWISRGTRRTPTRAPQVCVLSRQRIVGATNGSSVYLLGLCAALRDSGHDVHLVCPSPSMFGRWPVLRMRPEMDVFRSIAIRRSLRIGGTILTTDPATIGRALVGVCGKILARLGLPVGRLDQPAPYAIGQEWTRRDRLFVARHARAHADIILCDYAFLTEGIPYALRPDALSMVIMHDLFSSRAAQFDRLGAADSVATIDEAAEMAMLSKADAVIAIQADEAAIVRHRLPGRKVIVAPVAITPVDAPRPGHGHSMLFVGGDTAPNVQGLLWFLDTVWPLVRTGVPDATLDVAGAVGAKIGPPPDGVRVLGLVRDLAAVYRDVAVVISPLRAGSGLKIKLIEALGHGKAVVATSVTLQGVAEAAANAVSVADEPADFAAAAIALLGDEALRLARATAALDLARARFSPAACHAELLAFVAKAG